MRKFGIFLIFFSIGLFVNSYSQTPGLEIGNKAPEIKLPTPVGDTIALSTLRGKLVLIDFWATWCSPCAKEQPELGKLYNNYKNAEFTNSKGFEIYGISLDSKKTTWQNFISNNNIDWIQVSDLKFWSSPVAKLYNLQELPYNLLIDGNGIILSKNLHGEDLEKEIKKYLVK